MERRLWSKAIVAILKTEEAQSLAAVVARYDRLIGKVRRASEDYVSHWELGEALNLRAMYLEGRGRFKDALSGYLAVAELRRGHLISNGHSLASALEAAVSAAIRTGQRRKALSLAREVIRLRGDYPYASEALEVVVRLLREEQKRQSDRARRQQLQAHRRAVRVGRRRPTKS